MLFNSLEFLIFFAIVYPTYLFLPHRWQNRLLLVSSYVFYGFWNWKLLSLILFSTSVDYFMGLKIFEADTPAKKKRFVTISVLVNLGLLGFFKYFNFFAASFADLLHIFNIPVEMKVLNIILPIGISFYTFQAMSYTIDIYRGLVKPARKFEDFATFVCFFPQLVAGPIERAAHMLPQFLKPRKVSWELFCEGGFLFFWGLFEKIFIADNLAKIVNPIFSSAAPYHGGEVLLALYAFTFQIFCDFDAYSNMARGLGKTLGFDIIFNFNLPYFATNPREFWQRWHISLSSWLRDYLYISLGGNRGSELKTYRNLALTMLLGGLWHGASWTFLAWGMYQGFLLIAHRWIISLKNFKLPHWMGHPLLKHIFFFHCIVLGWLFFRSSTINQSWSMLQAVFTDLSFSKSDLSIALQICGFIIPLLLIQLIQWKKNDLMILYKQHWFIKTVVYALMTYAMLSWGVMKAVEFIYFQF